MMLVWCGICKPCCLFSLCLSLQVSHQAPHWLVHLVVLIGYQLDLVWLEMSLLRLFILITKWPDHGIEPSVGKKESAYYMFYLPIGFLISFAVFFLGRIRYEQSRTLYLQCQSKSIETEFLEWLSFIQLFICVCWLLPQGENHQATVA